MATENNDIRNKAIKDFIVARYPNKGTLKVQVSTGKGNFPIKDAVVEVATNLNGQHKLIYRHLTDNSGIVDNILLPANPSSESQNSQTAGGSGVNYLVSVSHPSFVDQNELVATIYSNVGSILPVDLVPLFTTQEEA